MSLYSRLLLHFIHTISNGCLNVEAFVFGTRLTRITHQLKKRDVDEAIRAAQKQSKTGQQVHVLEMPFTTLTTHGDGVSWGEVQLC